MEAKPPDYEKYEHNTFAFHETIQKSFSEQSTFQVWGAKATNDLSQDIAENVKKNTEKKPSLGSTVDLTMVELPGKYEVLVE